MSSKFALIIGNTEYIDPGLAQLTAPGKDAEDFARLLKDSNICAFDQVDVLLNQLSSTVIEAIDEFFDQKKPDDLLVLYFSGHGVRDELGSLYLAVRNTIRNRLRSTAIKSDYIREVMDQSRSKRQVLILDCCNSGAFEQGTKAAIGVSIGTASAFEAGYGRIILTASDSTQFAWEGDKVIGETDNSLFTHYLVQGLEGEADLDGDGRITVDELYDYAYDKVKLVTPKQTPSKFSSKQQGEIILRQITRLEDIKLIPLPDELLSEIDDIRPYVREAAVQKLEKIIKGRNIGMARSAIEALEKIATDENTTRRVAQMASAILESVRQAEQKAEEERRAKEEADRLAALKAEEERLAREKAQAERKAKEEAEREAARLKTEREAAEKAAREAVLKAAQEKAEREASEQDEAQRAEREALGLASRRRAEREAAEKAEREAIELATRRKVEREAKEEIAVKEIQPTNRSLLTIGIIATATVVLVLCGFGMAKLLPSLFGPAGPTSPAATEAPVTEQPVLEVSATEPPVTSDNPFPGKSLVAPNCDYGGFIESIVATDSHSVAFTLCKPDPAFLSKIASNVFAIYPSEWLEATAGDQTRTSEGLEKPIGTGPYMVSEWNRGESLTFIANPDYWGEAPKAKTLVFRWSDESAACLLELQSGTIDGYDNVSSEDVARVQGDSNLVLVNRPSLNVFYVGMTNTFPPFDNQLVRQAIARGIDRQRIVDRFYPEGSVVASHFTPCEIPNGCVGDPWYAFDPEAGRALLAEAGFPDGFSTKLYYRDVVRAYLPQATNVAEDIKAQLRDNLNIEVEIVVMESGQFIQESTTGQLDGLYLFGWGADYPHVTNFLEYHFSASDPQFGEQSPTYYEKLGLAAQTADEPTAARLYGEVNNAIREFVPMVPIAHAASNVAYRADVQPRQAHPFTIERFYLSDPGGRDVFVWMQNYEPISLFCADQSDGESLRGCAQVTEGLYTYEINSANIEPALAESCEPNEDLTVWTCVLRQGVKFHDGSDFDANDVVDTFTMGLDASSPLHKGNSNSWDYYSSIWGLINNP